MLHRECEYWEPKANRKVFLEFDLELTIDKTLDQRKDLRYPENFKSPSPHHQIKTFKTFIWTSIFSHWIITRITRELVITITTIDI